MGKFRNNFLLLLFFYFLFLFLFINLFILLGFYLSYTPYKNEEQILPTSTNWAGEQQECELW